MIFITAARGRFNARCSSARWIAPLRGGQRRSGEEAVVTSASFSSMLKAAIEAMARVMNLDTDSRLDATQQVAQSLDNFAAEPQIDGK